MGVYKVRVTSEKDPYVYKEVDNPLNEPRNSKVLEQELQDLELLRGTEGVVQLVAAVVSKNPYHTGNTIENDTSIVLRGILLGYYPNGTLQDALTLLKSKDLQFLRWAVQITTTLARLHQMGITHMDSKPQNIVLNKDFSPVIVDLSGIGGTTRKWLSPEMKDLSDALSQDMESRAQNDIWALGKILLAMAEFAYDEIEELALW